MANTRQLFETTVSDLESNLAVRVLSLPSRWTRDPRATSSDRELLRALGLRAEYEIPRAYFSEALAAILANTHIDDAAAWLAAPPNAVPLDIPEDLLSPRAMEHRWVDEDRLAVDLAPPGPARERPKAGSSVPKGTPEAIEIESFARVATGEVRVPFQRSPVQFISLPELVQMAEAARTWLVTAGTNPLILVKLAGGYLLFQTVLGVGGASVEESRPVSSTES